MNKDIQNKFAKVYQNGTWKSGESYSGGGSDVEETNFLILNFGDFMRELGIKSLYDAACGDFNWMRFVNLTGIKYVGGDIVEELIQQNKSLYPDTDFVVCDITTDTLGEYDAILCRDLFVHFNNDDFRKAIANIKQSGSKYLIATTFPNHNNDHEYQTGEDWRYMSLNKPPFNFPQPIAVINEQCTAYNMLYTDKSLGVYLISEIK